MCLSIKIERYVLKITNITSYKHRNTKYTRVPTQAQPYAYNCRQLISYACRANGYDLEMIGIADVELFHTVL